MTRTYTPPSNGGLRTPAEMLRSEIRAVRETGKRHVRRRLGLGWSAEDAANVAIGAVGRPAGGGAAKRGRVIPRTGERLIDPDERWSEDDRAWYVVTVNPDGLTLDQVGALLDVSREYARQLEVRAIQKLRVALARDGLSADDVGDWLSRRPEREPDRSAPSAPERHARAGLPDWRGVPLPVEPWSEHGQRVEAACCELDAIMERAQARRQIDRVIAGMEGPCGIG